MYLNEEIIMSRMLEDFCYETNDHLGGVQKLYQFDNKMGASVIKHEHSYGGKLGLWELAVLDGAGEIDYSTPITNDVLGRLTWREVTNTLRQIQSL